MELLCVFSRAASEGAAVQVVAWILLHMQTMHSTHTQTHTSPDQLLITTILSYIRVSPQLS